MEESGCYAFCTPVKVASKSASSFKTSANQPDRIFSFKFRNLSQAASKKPALEKIVN